MKVALVCIAKNEDNYIEEWYNYHKKIGFDHIFIYQNNWRCTLEKEDITKIEFDGIAVQTNAYNNFLETYKNDYDWVAFFDVDEFLVLHKNNNIKEYLFNYDNSDAIAINWLLFGDNNINKIDNNYKVVDRFTKRQNSINQHIKTIVKLNRNIIMNVHSPANSNWIDSNSKISNGPFNIEGTIDKIQLNHYFTKTLPEFLEKQDRGRADTNIKRNVSEFHSCNYNEIEDLNAYNFKYK
jgi:hypothetical protein